MSSSRFLPPSCLFYPDPFSIPLIFHSPEEIHPPSPLISSQEEEEVEAILDRREEAGTASYLVRWRGLGAEGDTWEPEGNLSCRDMVEEFEGDPLVIVASPSRGEDVQPGPATVEDDDGQCPSDESEMHHYMYAIFTMRIMSWATELKKMITIATSWHTNKVLLRERYLGDVFAIIE